MDIISYNIGATANSRIEIINANPDSTSGIVTVPKTIASGETVTIPAGRVAVLPNVQVDGEIVVEGDGEIFIPSGATLSGVVELEGNQTISDVKTFLESPIVPTPTTGTQAVNKDYADLKVALVSFTGTNQSLTGSGYQKLPGGLIIQWGIITTSGITDTIVTYPIAFPNATLRGWGTASGNTTVGLGNGTATTISIATLNPATGAFVSANLNWFTIGY